MNLTDPLWLRRSFPEAKPDTLTKVRQMFVKLNPSQRELAMVGVGRHFFYCDKFDCGYDAFAVLELIRDARHYRAMWLETREIKVKMVSV